MSKNKNNFNLNADRLVEIIYQSIYEIIDDETGNSSYRKYFDKVIHDIFGLDGVATAIMMSGNQMKYIKKLLEDPDYKVLCQMLLRDEDVKVLYDLTRVAYDAAQIAHKSKKRISSKDIKSYKYLTKLYTHGIKALRKKYKINKDSKKSYKNKYSGLSKMIGKSSSTYHYDLGESDDDDEEDFGDLYEEDDEDDDSQFESMNGYSLDDLPSKFMISDKSFDKSPSMNTQLIDDENLDLELYEHSLDSNELLMPEPVFQRYTVSVFEKLLKHLDSQDKTEHMEEYKPMYISTDEDTDSYDTVDNIGTEDNSILPEENNMDDELSKSPIADEDKNFEDMSRKEIIDKFNSSPVQDSDDSNKTE